MRTGVKAIKILLKFFWLFLIVTAVGCGLIEKNPDQWQPIKQKKKSFVHTVKYSNESLEIIAAWYTGKGVNVIALANANPNINPNRLLVGNRIYIPKNLLKIRKPMPQEYPKKWTAKNTKRRKMPAPIRSSKKKSPARASTTISKKKAPPAKASPPAEKDDDLDLFGPK